MKLLALIAEMESIMLENKEFPILKLLVSLGYVKTKVRLLFVFFRHVLPYITEKK